MHSIHPPNSPRIYTKPIQNWLHAIMGLVILAVGYATVWTGIDLWPEASDLPPVPRSVKILFWILLGVS